MKAQEFKIGDVLEINFVYSGTINQCKIVLITEKGIQVKKDIVDLLGLKNSLIYIKFRHIYFGKYIIKHIKNE